MKYEDLSDRELRIEIAKRHGWYQMTIDNETFFLPLESSHYDRIGATFHDGIPSYMEDWTRNIAQAWQLINHVRNDFDLVRISVELNDTDREWTTRFYFIGNIISASSQTACRSICIAYLYWMDKVDGKMRELARNQRLNHNESI